jgi:KipI family sensor histidine kinase inhibitor
MPEYRLLPAGDTALVVEFGDQIDRELNLWVLALDRRLKEARIKGITDCVPTFRSLLVHYDPLLLPAAALMARVSDLMQGLQTTETAGRVWRLPACYDASLAPDLEDVAARTGLTPAEVIERHSALTYHVYMLGFLPGQAYMGDLSPELALPRRETPRLRIPAGSLAIATTMTCILPMETPCGWHLIGRSPVRLWERTLGSEALLAPGDKVSFAPVSLREYEDLVARAAEGLLNIAPDDARVGAAA